MHDATPRAHRPFMGSFTRRQGVGWLMALPFWPPAHAQAFEVQLASNWPAWRSPLGFLVSEKFDGVRAVWDGQRLSFRSGRRIEAPSWFVGALPQHPLDGELWLARGQFDRLSGTVRQQRPDDEAWRAVRYLVFDAPGQSETFEMRGRALQAQIVQLNLPWLTWVEQFRVDSAANLQRQLETLVQAGAEGLVLHRADASWRPGRSDALFKFKPEPDDEARVLGYLPGRGRWAGMTGALVVETRQGQRFVLGTGLSESDRRHPPAVGSWVTYRYRDHTPKGVPRFASFVRLRAPE